MSKYIVDIHGEIEGDYEIVGKYEEQDPTTKNDLAVSSGLEKNSKKLEKDFGESDCISRADAQTEIEINASRYTIAKERGGMGQVEWSDQLIKVSDAVDIIRNLPSATSIRPKGHWIGQKKIGFGEWKECIVPLKDGFVTDSCSCSECGDWLTGSDEYQCSGNFCPNCGADMREVEE